MTLQKPLRAVGAPIILACAVVLAISPATAAAVGQPASNVSARAAGPLCGDSTLAPDGNDLPRITASILCLLNTQRSSAGLPALSLNRKLTRASQTMAKLMVREKFFSHETPDGRSLLDRIRVTGYLPRSDSWVLGENLAWGSGALATPQAIVDGWMKSAGHRANILASDYRDVGIGIALGSPLVTRAGGATYVTDFGARAVAASAPTQPAGSVPPRVRASPGPGGGDVSQRKQRPSPR